MKKRLKNSESQLQDMENIALIKLGDKNAFTSIFNKYKGHIAFKLYNCVNGDKNLADDLLMEIFEKIYSNIDKYKEEYTFNTWLTTVANNYAMDYFRDKKNKFTTPMSKFN